MNWVGNRLQIVDGVDDLSLSMKLSTLRPPEYLRRYVPSLRDVSYNVRSHRSFPNPQKRTSRYENSFFPFCISEWEKLNDDIKRSPSLQFPFLKRKSLILYDLCTVPLME